MSKIRGTDVAMAFGLGAVAGAVTALLLAPAKGEETRRRIGELAHEAVDKSKEGADTAGHYVKEQASRVEHAFKKGKEAYLEEAAKV